MSHYSDDIDMRYIYTTSLKNINNTDGKLLSIILGNCNETIDPYQDMWDEFEMYLNPKQDIILYMYGSNKPVYISIKSEFHYFLRLILYSCRKQD